jgi:hypothetical protein
MSEIACYQQLTSVEPRHPATVRKDTATSRELFSGQELFETALAPSCEAYCITALAVAMAAAIASL